MNQLLKSRTRFWSIFLLLGFFVYWASFLSPRDAESRIQTHHYPPSSGSNGYPWPDWHENLHFNEGECARTFPGLNYEIERAMLQGPLELQLNKGVALQGKVENGKLYIVRSPRRGQLNAAMRDRQRSSLNQLYRAIITSPVALPNTSFAIASHDTPIANTLSFARSVTQSSEQRVFPMPHFAFWSWPLPFVDSLPAARRAIANVEATTSFQEKSPRAVWRGTTWYNNGAGPHPRLRQNLILATKGATWADVEALQWETNSQNAYNALRIEDFCRYRYLIHTEGIGFSGRLQFHQLCESVILSPPLEWMQHTSHLIKPILSSTILGADDPTAHSSAQDRKAWPVEYPIAQANMVFVAPDWSDLEATVQWLEKHPDAAIRIAKNQRQKFEHDGYLSPAAEVCYWRALIRGWSDVVRPVGKGWDEKGLPFEEWVLQKDDALG